MVKRRTLVVGLALLTAGAWWLAGPTAGRRLRVENYPHVRVGMSQPEVEGLLGGPPGNYGVHADGGGAMMTLEGYLEPPGSVERVWCDDLARFEIYFDDRDQVVGHHRRAGYHQIPAEGGLTRWWRLTRRRLGL